MIEKEKKGVTDAMKELGVICKVTCILCCTSFDGEKAWEEHVRDSHYIEDLEVFEKDVLYLLPSLEGELRKYREIIERELIRKNEK